MAHVVYKGNGSDGGQPPVDSNSYSQGNPVNDAVNDSTKPPYQQTGPNANPLNIVTGNLTKTGATFLYWSTKPNGGGIIHGWPADTSFKFPNQSTNLTLYAQWAVTTRLTGGGVTTHYAFTYDSTLAASGIEPARTNAVIAACETTDYARMASLFPPGTNIGSHRSLPIPVWVTVLTGGANTTGVIRLKPGNEPAAFLLRELLVAEVTEIFMSTQNAGWGYSSGANNEQSCGEALSLFLTEQFQLKIGQTLTSTGSGNAWLNSSLPTSNPKSTRYYDKKGTSQGYDYGSRVDYVNSTLNWPGNAPGTGCSILFIYYLYHQLGFTIPQIIAAAPGLNSSGTPNDGACLRGVYQNLTGDTSDPFPYFAGLLANAFPPDQVSSIPGPNPDDPWPLASFGYWGVKDTFGKDEVADLLKPPSNGVYANGFSLALEGFNTQVLGTTTPTPPPTIAFGGVTAVPAASGAVTYQFANPKIPQRVLFNYDIHFDPSPALGTFPATNETPAAGKASIGVLGQTFRSETDFFFLAGADPYFANVQPNPLNVQPNPLNPTSQNVPWLSQDLRVFTATPHQPGSQLPVPSPQYAAPLLYPVPAGAPTFVENRSYGDYDIQGAYHYITNLIAYLNKAYGDPSKADPFEINNSILPGQIDAYTGDSSVAPGTKANGTIYNNYNFAIARVRLRGSSGRAGAAPGVKVFFRLWQTQTADTDWNPSYTYLSDDPTGLNPQYPKAPVDNHTIPFFASGNYPVLNDPPNKQTITINQGDTQWAYFGCFLNLYDSNFSVNGQPVQPQFPQGTHHCLVAEIAYKDAPIRNVGTAGETTENSDQLAQRNLQVTTSANPGDLATHRIPQTFDVRRTDPTTAGLAGALDELMIDWGNTPTGCLASIYWPGANAAEILSIASRIYGTQVLSPADNHTIQCKTTRESSYVPIPLGTGASLAGLLTIDLPATVVKGQEFDIVVRRIGTRRVKDFRAERYIVGSFQVKIPVKSKADMVPAEETTLAILKARLAAMSPKNRWWPVLERYLGLIAARVDGLGGDANAIPPSFHGYAG